MGSNPTPSAIRRAALAHGRPPPFKATVYRNLAGAENALSTAEAAFDALRLLMAGHRRKGDMELPEGLKRVECPEPAFTELVEGVEGLAFVYILYCRNGSFYVGQSADVRKRLLIHQRGFGARHTKLLKEFELVYTEGPMRSDAAIKRERQLKKWSKAKKLALIMGDLEELKRLAKSSD